MQIDGLREFVKFVAGRHQYCDQHAPRWQGHPVAALIDDLGVEFQAAPLPEDVKWGEIKNCFGNAGTLAIHDDRYTYVEGYAFSLIPTMHAWVWDNELKQIVDNTWRNAMDEGAAYFGIPIQTTYLTKVVSKNGTWGVLDTYWDKFSILEAPPEEFYQKIS